VHDATAIVGEDEEAVEQPECGGRDDEEVASDGLGHVILEESAPALRGWPVLSSRHVLCDDGVRLDQDEARSPGGPESVEQHPEKPIAQAQLVPFDVWVANSNFS